MNSTLRLLRQSNLLNNLLREAKYVQRFYAKNKDGKCDVDRCGCPIPKKESKKPYKIVKEKSCKPCSFWSWTPRIPKLGIKPIEECAKKYREKPPSKVRPRKCVAGMKIKKKPSTCERKEDAEICQASTDPKKPSCPPKKEMKKKKKAKRDCPDKYPIPKSDWQRQCK